MSLGDARLHSNTLVCEEFLRGKGRPRCDLPTFASCPCCVVYPLTMNQKIEANCTIDASVLQSILDPISKTYNHKNWLSTGKSSLAGTGY